jgi:hypothetical protein
MYKVEEKLHLGVRQQKRFNTTVIGNKLTDGSEVVSLNACRPVPPITFLVLTYVRGSVYHKAIVQVELLYQMKNQNNLFGMVPRPSGIQYSVSVNYCTAFPTQFRFHIFMYLVLSIFNSILIYILPSVLVN